MAGAKPRSEKKKRSKVAATSARSTRARLVLLGSVVLSAAILAAWFPAVALLHQRSNLSSASAQLRQMHSQDAALAQERKNLNAAAEITAGWRAVPASQSGPTALRGIAPFGNVGRYRTRIRLAKVQSAPSTAVEDSTCARLYFFFLTLAYRYLERPVCRATLRLDQYLILQRSSVSPFLIFTAKVQ